MTGALAASLAVALSAVFVGAALISWLLDNGARYGGRRSGADMVLQSLADGTAPGLVTAGLIGVIVLAVADGVRRSLVRHRGRPEPGTPAAIGVLLDRSVLVLAAAALLGGAAIWRLVSWRVEAEQIWSEIQDAPPTPEQQRLLGFYELLPFLLTPSATMLFVTALIGLPIVIGARYAALVRYRDVDRSGGAAARMQAGSGPEEG